MPIWIKNKGTRSSKRSVEGGGTAAFVLTDVTQPTQVQTLVDFAVNTYGGLDILFNNAGIDGEFGATTNCSLENWQHVIDVNLNAVFYALKYATPVMLASGGGSIINTASVVR